MTTLKQLSFVGGELSPSLYGRVDQSKYQTGCRTLRNFMIMRHGGITNRPGTEFLAEVADSTDSVRLIPFVFNADQTYVLELGNQVMRVYRNGAITYDSTLTGSITGISNANPAVVTIASHPFSNGDELIMTGIVGDIGDYLNGRQFIVANAGANDFELTYKDGTNVNSTSFGSYSSGGTADGIYEIATPWSDTELNDLDYVQSGDIITVAHPGYAPREISRTDHDVWSISSVTFAPEMATPTGITNSSSGSGGDKWVVTAVNDETSEESLATSETESSTAATSGSPITVSWDYTSGASYYNVYKNSNGVFGFIGLAYGTSGTISFSDDEIIPDTTDTPPSARNPFNASNDYPSAVAYIQQRLTFANTNNNTETIYMSRSGNYKNYTVSSPLQDDDAVTFTLAGRQVNEVRQLLDLGNFIVLTSGGEWTILGDEAGVIKPLSINPKQNSYNGSAQLKPIIVSNSALYVQARGTIIRDLVYDLNENGYKGNDLTIFSAHLFDNYSIVAWGYQQIPHSIIWVARSDGALLGLTYIREHQIWGWHRHDTDGLVKDVTVIPEGTKDTVYLVVERTINGSTVRYVEKMEDRFIDDDNLEELVLMDSSLSYDGTGSSSTTMTLSGGTNWTYDETITLTASSSTFDSTYVGNQIHLKIDEVVDPITGFVTTEADIIRFDIETYSSATVVTGKPHKTVPSALRSTAADSWGYAVDELGGLWHLEGKEVAIFADKFVVASPNNSAYTTATVTNGQITLAEHYVVIHVGLSYISDLETLDIDNPAGESIVGENKTVREVTFQFEASRGVWTGPNPPDSDATDVLDGLTELKIREDESYEDPVSLKTDTVSVNIDTEWNSNGRVFVRQVDPVPVSILSVSPSGLFPFGQQRS